MLHSLGMGAKAVLVLDNCPALQDTDDIVSEDGMIYTLFLPLTVTSLIQPMEQGVLQAFQKDDTRKISEETGYRGRK